MPGCVERGLQVLLDLKLLSVDVASLGSVETSFSCYLWGEKFFACSWSLLIQRFPGKICAVLCLLARSVFPTKPPVGFLGSFGQAF